MDVRSPVEFNKGAFPCAINRPLMSDAEREAVGICYKQRGQAAAVALGHQLVTGEIKAQRVAAWVEFSRRHPEGYLYCFRGGMRSQIVQSWLKEYGGIEYPRVDGGYKALRQFLVTSLQDMAVASRFVVLGGLTGTGKTQLIRRFENGIDLEGHAHHQGSSFGRHPTAQPSQIDFENRLAIDMLKKHAQGYRALVVEDEGGFIGSCYVPLELRRSFTQSPVVWVERSLPERVTQILQDYVVNRLEEFVSLMGQDAGFQAFADHLRASLGKIAKRLGGERYQRINQLLDQALVCHRTGDIEPHRRWIEWLITEYYDPMYRFQREKLGDRVIFVGPSEESWAFIKTLG